MEGYLENSGWRRKPGGDPLYTSWAKTISTEDIELLVPSQKTVADYRGRMADLLRDLEQAENRSQLAIFEDLLTADADVLRICLQGPSYRTSLLPIDLVDDLVRAARDLLLAAACSANKAEPFYPTRPPKPALDFLRRVRLGFPEPGTVNLKFFAEVPPARRFPFEEQAPFARATMIMLGAALDFTSTTHGSRPSLEPDRITQDSVRAGVSANLCEALGALCGELSDDHAVEITISYAPALPIKPAARRFWQFRPSDKDFLKALGQTLRESGIEDNYHLVGFVHAIEERRDNDCSVSILAWIREKVTRVSVRMDEEQEGLAIRALEQRLPIECYGQLLERKQRFSLAHPHDVKLYSYPDDPTLAPLRKAPSSEPGSFGFLDKNRGRKRPQ